MDRTGYLNKITQSVIFIYKGRDGLNTEGRAEEGRVNYQKGLRLGIDTFREVRAHADCDLELPVACEYAFLNQELQFCASDDDRARTSLTKDAFHVACAAHRARIDNILKSPGINLLEKALLKERRTAMQAVQSAYLEKQRRTLATA